MTLIKDNQKINALYAYPMTQATLNAYALANQDLVVAHVGATESDVLELRAPEDDTLDSPAQDGEASGADANAGAAEGNSDAASDVAVSVASSIMSDEASSSSEQSLPSTTDDDTDSIDSDREGKSVRKVVTVTIPSNSDSRTVTNAIVGGDGSAEADANAVPEVKAVENRLNESSEVPWEDYVAPAPDGDDGDDGDDDGGDDDGDDEMAGLGPVDRARLRFRRSLEDKLRFFAESGVAEPLLVQMLTHG